MQDPIEKSDKIAARQVAFVTRTGAATTSSLRGSFEKQSEITAIQLYLHVTHTAPTARKPEMTAKSPQRDHIAVTDPPIHTSTYTDISSDARQGCQTLAQSCAVVTSSKAVKPHCSPICIHFMHLILTALVNSFWKEKKTLVSPPPELLHLVKCH